MVHAVPLGLVGAFHPVDDVMADTVVGGEGCAEATEGVAQGEFGSEALFRQEVRVGYLDGAFVVEVEEGGEAEGAIEGSGDVAAGDEGIGEVRAVGIVVAEHGVVVAREAEGCGEASEGEALLSEVVDVKAVLGLGEEDAVGLEGDMARGGEGRAEDVREDMLVAQLDADGGLAYGTVPRALEVDARRGGDVMVVRGV